MSKWLNRVAVVTGSAIGIGKCIAKDFLKEGMVVVGIDRNEKGMHDFKAALANEHKSRFHAITCDIRNVADLDAAFDKIIKDLGGVDVLVNNAGVHYMVKFIDADMTLIHEVVNTNLTSVIHCTQRAYKSMKERNFDGHIIMMNSISGHKVLPLSVGVRNAYTPCKFAMTALTDVLRQEFRDDGTGVKVSVSQNKIITNTYTTKSK